MKWDYVSKVRRLMKDNKVIKIPGYSWIEINNCVHEFRSGDRRWWWMVVMATVSGGGGGGQWWWRWWW